MFVSKINESKEVRAGKVKEEKVTLFPEPKRPVYDHREEVFKSVYVCSVLTSYGWMEEEGKLCRVLPSF